MSGNTLDKTRAFFNSLIGKDKPFKSRVKLAEFLGMDELAVQVKFFRFLKGESDSAYSYVTGWLERLGGKVFLPEESPEALASFRFVPKVAAVAGAGASLKTSDAIVGYYAFRTDFLGREHISERQSVLMDVRGDSMEPTLKDGDTVLIDQSEKEILDGRIYVVTLGDELRVKRVQKGWDGIVLTSDNSRYSDIHIAARDLEAFKVHGRVRWVGKML